MGYVSATLQYVCSPAVLLCFQCVLRELIQMDTEKSFRYFPIIQIF